MLAADELDALYQAECALAFEEIKREEDARFFNLPHTAADFAYCSKMEHWSSMRPSFAPWAKHPSLSAGK
jgi:hypothetical protein